MIKTCILFLVLIFSIKSQTHTFFTGSTFQSGFELPHKKLEYSLPDIYSWSHIRYHFKNNNSSYSIGLALFGGDLGFVHRINKSAIFRVDFGYNLFTESFIHSKVIFGMSNSEQFSTSFGISIGYFQEIHDVKSSYPGALVIGEELSLEYKIKGNVSMGLVLGISQPIEIESNNYYKRIGYTCNVSLGFYL